MAGTRWKSRVFSNVLQVHINDFLCKMAKFLFRFIRVMRLNTILRRTANFLFRFSEVEI